MKIEQNIANINFKIKILNKKKLSKILIMGCFITTNFLAVNEAKITSTEKSIINAKYSGVATITSICYCTREIVNYEAEIKKLVKRKNLYLKNK